jgi:hypothetical protein
MIKAAAPAWCNAGPVRGVSICVIVPVVVNCAALRAVDWQSSCDDAVVLGVRLAVRAGPPRGRWPPDCQKGRRYYGGGRGGHVGRGHWHCGDNSSCQRRNKA